MLSQVDALGLKCNSLALMLDDVDADTSWSEFLWDKLEAARFSPSFVLKATQDMRTSCALASMLGLTHELGLRSFGHLECRAEIPAHNDFDYLPLPIGLSGTLESLVAVLDSSGSGATLAGRR
jgi:hypothetical protein